MPADFSDRFDRQRYENEGDIVEFRAHRGTRRASIMRQHLVAEVVFLRAFHLARAYDLHQLENLELYATTELNKLQARALADEVAFLTTVVIDTLLAPHLAGIKDIADFCWRTTQPAWLIVEGP